VFVFGIHQINAQDPEEKPILWTANWSYDDAYFAVGGNDNILRIYDGKTWSLIRKDTLEDAILRLRWHPSKHLLAMACAGKSSQILDMETGHTHPLKGCLTGSRAIDWNPDGSKLAMAAYDGQLLIYNEKGNRIISVKKENSKSFVGVDWHPKKDMLIALGEAVYVYDGNGQELNRFSHRKEEVLMLSVEWHQSGNFFVIGDYGDPEQKFPPLLQYWDKDYHLISESAIGKAEYRNLSWNKKGNRLASSSDALRIWNKKGKLLYTGNVPDLLWGVDFSNSGKFIVTSSIDGRITIWDSHAKKIKEL
jgi:WD40 repeat protein